MSAATGLTHPRVVAVAPGSPAARAGVAVGDEVVAVNGEPPRDLIRYRLLADGPAVSLDIDRGGLALTIEIDKPEGQPLGAEVHSALFDALTTCDNHCEFCFIHQLPTGLRRSLYKRDDDFRLSFLFGNFTTLTRFTEADLERVVTEGLSPLHVSIHATEPDVRADLLHNPRGGSSLRWLRALLDHGVEVHGQVVVCPGVNDGVVLDDTMVGVLDRYPELATLAVVPLGVSRFNTADRMRPHTTAEAAAVIDCVEEWQELYVAVLGRRLAYAADEYYLLAGRPFPPADTYGTFAMYEDGIGMARAFEQEFLDIDGGESPGRDGFFAWADAGAAAAAGGGEYEAYRGPRGTATTDSPVRLRPRPSAPVGVLTGAYGRAVLEPLVASLDRHDARVIEVPNHYFGGNIGVTGLMVGEDVARALSGEPAGHRYLLPDVCLSQGRFLDGTGLDDLPRAVEVVATDGRALRRALGG